MPLIKLKAGVKFDEHSPDICLKDARLVRDALIEAFFEGDVSGFKEILAAHLRAISKDDLSKKAGVSRATVFRMLDTESNPSFENVSKVLSTLKIAV
jgi:DNA-binding phage protein